MSRRVNEELKTSGVAPVQNWDFLGTICPSTHCCSTSSDFSMSGKNKPFCR